MRLRALNESTIIMDFLKEFISVSHPIDTLISILLRLCKLLMGTPEALELVGVGWDLAVKDVQTPCRNSGNSGVGWSWLGLGLSLGAMPLLLIGSRRSGADWSNSEMLVMSTSSR